MSPPRLADFLDHIRQAATDAASFVEGMEKDEFLEDRLAQMGVMMSFVIIGEAAAKIMDAHPDFTQAHPDVPWRGMRNMRNRMAHGYFDINYELVWETVQTILPDMLQKLPSPASDS